MRKIALALALLGAASQARGAETASFLDIGVGGRALAMGGAHTALADDANALYWNPAGLAALEKRHATASHAELTVETRHDFLAYAQPTAQGSFAAGLTYLSHERLDGRDAAGRRIGGFEASDTALAAAWGRRTSVADLGLSIKYLRSHIGSAEAQGAALDAGLRKVRGPWRLAAALRNLGPGLKYDQERNELPLRAAFGAAYQLSGGHALAAELVNGPRGAGTDGGFGGEYRAAKGLFLRAGYTSKSALPGGSGFDAARGLTLGLGLAGERWSLDYAALPMGELGSAHRFSVGWSF